MFSTYRPWLDFSKNWTLYLVATIQATVAQMRGSYSYTSKKASLAKQMGWAWPVRYWMTSYRLLPLVHGSVVPRYPGTIIVWPSMMLPLQTPINFNMYSRHAVPSKDSIVFSPWLASLALTYVLNMGRRLWSYGLTQWSVATTRICYSRRREQRHLGLVHGMHSREGDSIATDCALYHIDIEVLLWLWMMCIWVGSVCVILSVTSILGSMIIVEDASREGRIWRSPPQAWLPYGVTGLDKSRGTCVTAGHSAEEMGLLPLQGKGYWMTTTKFLKCSTVFLKGLQMYP